MDEGQIKIIQGCIDIGALISVIGSSAMLISIISTGSFLGKGKIWNRVIFFMSLCDMCGSFDLLIRKNFLNKADKDDGCKIHGLTIQFFFISSILWTTAIAVNIVAVGLLDKEVEVVEKYEYLFHIVIWSISILLTVPLYYIDNANRNGNGGHVMGDATFWCWITDRYSKYRMLFFFGPIWMVFFFNAFVYISMEIINKKRNKDMNETYSKYSVAKRSNLFLLVFFITWIWGTINRIQNLISSGKSIFILYLLHAIFTPLQGFLNSMVYFWYSIIEHFIIVKKEIKEQEDNRRKNRPRHNSNNARLEEGRPIKLVHKRSDRDLFDNYYVFKPVPSLHRKDRGNTSFNELNNNLDDSNHNNKDYHGKDKRKTLERQKTNVTQYSEYSCKSTSHMLKSSGS
ncbi:hypothetical protein H8356DRAFT_1305955 [Neocallimastix lanati (nom. inval.)]|jgi:hypothetical protein|uniref:G-protein coupled receptors family 2 profile 2 domain-containing protein n=1 Tax=Neocallimastix californiae TaxID=1754190 RepID=A0A1Y2AMP7_9FUNG|nr:hypothetical protein H8356DRAFT_1305955 [Neocallimastix sp. JGI-2020a]ORY23848.1 hypothetical protein LY90DRAFT_675393 [Neocallimastix californiae]|eukprot:ORY23848.1 hypothetical protein LY90DRAFT_675393 [Neocallimastix californiae]